ncbi:MAG: hypothetical protein IJT22_05200 [Synergistaceae bacterium]|nr:hypothetical protein [Synergistaceae bacterium]
MTISTCEIVAVNAGHEYPIIKDGSGLFELKKSQYVRPLGLNPKTGYT